MTEPTWQGPETEKWRKELILLGDQTHRLFKQGGGWTGEGVLMSLKMFLNITRTQRLPKTLQSTSRLSQSPGKGADKGASCLTQLSGASYLGRKQITAISCKTAELQQFWVVMSDVWVVKLDNDEWSIAELDPYVVSDGFMHILTPFAICSLQLCGIKIYHLSKESYRDGQWIRLWLWRNVLSKLKSKDLTQLMPHSSKRWTQLWLFNRSRWIY